MKRWELEMLSLQHILMRQPRGLLRSGSLVSRRTNGLPAKELEALSERGCRATAGSYRTDEKNCSRIRLVDLAELFIELYRPRPTSCIPQFPLLMLSLV